MAAGHLTSNLHLAGILARQVRADVRRSTVDA